MSFQGAGGAGSTSWFRNFFSLSNIFLKLSGVISVTVLIIFITSFGALIESIKEGNMVPFIKTVGGKLVNYDTQLLVSANKIENAGGLLVNYEGEKISFLGKVKYFFIIIGAVLKAIVGLWYLWFFGFIFYKVAIMITNNASAVTSNILIMLIFLIVLQMFAHFVIIDKDATEGYNLTTADKLTPFKGTFKFIKVSPLLFNPIYERVSDLDTNKVVGGNVVNLNTV